MALRRTSGVFSGVLAVLAIASIVGCSTESKPVEKIETADTAVSAHSDEPLLVYYLLPGYTIEPVERKVYAAVLSGGRFVFRRDDKLWVTQLQPTDFADLIKTLKARNVYHGTSFRYSAMAVDSTHDVIAINEKNKVLFLAAVNDDVQAATTADVKELNDAWLIIRAAINQWTPATGGTPFEGSVKMLFPKDSSVHWADTGIHTNRVDQ